VASARSFWGPPVLPGRHQVGPAAGFHDFLLYYNLLYGYITQLSEKFVAKINVHHHSAGRIMNQETIDYFRDYLTQRLQELLNRADNTVTGMTNQKETFPDPTDRASLESDRNFMLRIRDRENKLIKKIRKALDRIEDGSFGICESCGEDISMERLKARPVTTLCIECKTKQEAMEKALGL
jgi:DnaK suppressor protein